MLAIDNVTYGYSAPQEGGSSEVLIGVRKLLLAGQRIGIIRRVRPR